jgi:cytosine/uracil/thiamine/allantoin permease
VQRFPLIIHAGAAVLALTAAKMIVSEPLLDPLFDPPQFINTVARYGTYVAAVAGVLLAGWWVGRRHAVANDKADSPHAA